MRQSPPDDEWVRTVQQQIDERRRIVIERDRAAGEGRHIQGEALGVEPMTAHASSDVDGTGRLRYGVVAQGHHGRTVMGDSLSR